MYSDKHVAPLSRRFPENVNYRAFKKSYTEQTTSRFNNRGVDTLRVNFDRRAYVERAERKQLQRSGVLRNVNRLYKSNSAEPQQRQRNFPRGRFLAERRDKQRLQFGHFDATHMRKMAKALPRDVPQRLSLENLVNRQQGTFDGLARTQDADKTIYGDTSQGFGIFGNGTTSGDAMFVYRPNTTIPPNVSGATYSMEAERSQMLNSARTYDVMSRNDLTTTTVPDKLTHDISTTAHDTSTMTYDMTYGTSTMIDDMTYSTSTITDNMTNDKSTMTDDMTKDTSTMTEDLTNVTSTMTEDVTNDTSTMTDDLTNDTSTMTDDMTPDMSTMTGEATHGGFTMNKEVTHAVTDEVTQNNTKYTVDVTHMTATRTGEMKHNISTITATLTQSTYFTTGKITIANSSTTKEDTSTDQDMTPWPVTSNTPPVAVTNDTSNKTEPANSNVSSTTVQNAERNDVMTMTSQTEDHHWAINETDILQTTSTSIPITTRRDEIVEHTGNQNEIQQTQPTFDFVTVAVSDRMAPQGEIPDAVSSDVSTSMVHNYTSDTHPPLADSSNYSTTYSTPTSIPSDQNIAPKSRFANQAQNSSGSTPNTTKNANQYTPILPSLLPNVTISTNTTKGFDHITKNTTDSGRILYSAGDDVPLDGVVSRNVSGSRERTDGVTRPTTGQKVVGCKGRRKPGRRRKVAPGVEVVRPASHGEGIRSGGKPGQKT